MLLLLLLAYAKKFSWLLTGPRHMLILCY